MQVHQRGSCEVPGHWFVCMRADGSLVLIGSALSLSIPSLFSLDASLYEREEKEKRSEAEGARRTHVFGLYIGQLPVQCRRLVISNATWRRFKLDKPLRRVATLMQVSAMASLWPSHHGNEKITETTSGE